jgi:bacteriophage N4 adsorption protein B
VRHNLAAIRYSKFDFFLGVYPNDTETLKAVNELARLYRNVHAACVPHDGPTSKADCLNWSYQALCDFEETHGIRFDTVVVHDAEDLIHPDALRVIHTKRFEYDMVQVPVLPLPTGIVELTHGIYCDEFAEFQAIDMRARVFSKSFLPSNGVGTGYSRIMLDRLAEVRSNRVFEPVALTEDYESGVRIHQLGFKQIFARMRPDGANGDTSQLIATREYFPRSFRTAVRQRIRWVTGICLQGWERIGWKGSLIDRYWF